MRIISGEYKGRRLKLPDNVPVRPTPERVREAVFSMLGADLSGQTVLDLFTGGGGIAFEALSRGADHVTMADRDDAVVRYLNKSAALLRIPDSRYEIIHGDYRSALKKCIDLHRIYDIVYIDPPYASGYYISVLEALNDHLLREDAWVLVESNQPMEDHLAGFTATRRKQFGTISLTLYQKEP